MGNGKLEGKLVVFLWRNADVTCHELKSRSRGVGIFRETICFGIRNVSGALHMVSPGSLAGLYCSKGIYASIFLTLGTVATPFVSLKLRYAHGHERRAEDKWNGFNFFAMKTSNQLECVYFNILNQRLKAKYLCLAPEERTLTFWLSSKYQKHHHFKVWDLNCFSHMHVKLRVPVKKLVEQTATQLFLLCSNSCFSIFQDSAIG